MSASAGLRSSRKVPMDVGTVLLLLLLEFVAILVCWICVRAASQGSTRRRPLGYRRPAVGPESLPGSFGTVVSLPDRRRPDACLVHTQGELWRARAVERLEVGEPCLVLEVEGNQLVVSRLPIELERRVG